MIILLHQYLFIGGGGDGVFICKTVAERHFILLALQQLLETKALSGLLSLWQCFISKAWIILFETYFLVESRVCCSACQWTGEIWDGRCTDGDPSKRATTSIIEPILRRILVALVWSYLFGWVGKSKVKEQGNEEDSTLTYYAENAGNTILNPPKMHFFKKEFSTGRLPDTGDTVALVEVVLSDP